MIFIIPVIFFFLNTSQPLSLNDSRQFDTTGISIYLVKQQWHIGIVLSISDVDSTKLPEIKYFRNYKNVDIGWGDEEFYQNPGFDFELAYNALFNRSSSVLRIEGFNIDLFKYAELSDIGLKIILNRDKFDLLCIYIHNKFFHQNGEAKILKEKVDGKIKFFNAKGNYYLFNTCNTWIAEGLKEIGFDISEDIILTQQLFKEAQRFGEIIKVED